MKSSLKGALLSGFIFPGLGQFWLKRRIAGAVLAIAALASLTVIVAKVTGRAYRLLEKAESEGGAVDLLAIVHSAQDSSSDDIAIRLAWLVALGSWTVSVVDAFLAGEKKDREKRSRK